MARYAPVLISFLLIAARLTAQSTPPMTLCEPTEPFAVSLATDTNTRTPSPVWQQPLTAVLVGSVFVAGTTPLYCEPARRQTILIREQVQMFRRNSLGFRQLHFDNAIQYIPLVSVVGLSLAGVPAEHEFWSLFRRSASTALIVTAIVQPIKLFVDEERPDRSSSTSFPSGHTAFSFAGAELLRLEYSRTSPLIPVAGFTVAALTGFMRVYNDRHWASDVLAGAAIGIISADLSHLLNNILDSHLHINKSRH